MNYTKELIKISKEFNVFDKTRFVLEDSRFPLWSGSCVNYHHHYGCGGLAEHTYEVVNLCLKTNDIMKSEIDPIDIVLAGIFHDSGKMFDYEPISDDNYSEWKAADHKYKIHHITRSALIWQENCDGYYNSDEILHAILAHHGLREWGSPVSPKTKLAWLLHLCDNLSARLNDCDKFSIGK